MKYWLLAAKPIARNAIAYIKYEEAIIWFLLYLSPIEPPKNYVIE